jgi:hypothetical protein
MADEPAVVAGVGITEECVDAVTQARAMLIRHEAAKIVGGRNARDIDFTAGMSWLRKLGWSLASGDSCGPARLTRVCAAVIAGYDRCLAAAGGLEAVREATVHDIARTPGSSTVIGVRRQINAARDNSGPTPDDGVMWGV